MAAFFTVQPAPWTFKPPLLTTASINKAALALRVRPGGSLSLCRSLKVKRQGDTLAQPGLWELTSAVMIGSFSLCQSWR